jgi:hypothetical protein
MNQSDPSFEVVGNGFVLPFDKKLKTLKELPFKSIR